MEIGERSLQDEHVPPGGTIWVEVAVRNSGGRPGEITFEATSPFENKTKTARIPPHTEKVVRLSLNVDSSPPANGIVRVNGRVVGEVNIAGVTETATTQDGGFSALVALIAFGILMTVMLSRVRRY